MASPLWDDDDALLADLSAALRGPSWVPADFVDAARASLTWRTVDAELAELTFDSACDLELAARTRSGGSTRTFTFSSGPVTLEIEVTSAGIVGQLTPAVGGGRISGQTAEGTFDEVSVDDVGCFELKAPPSGPARLHARTGEHTVVTTWVCLTP